MQGLLDFVKTPEGQGLLSGIFGYAANARRGQPINSLGRGGIAGLLGYSNALEREQDAKQNEWLQQYRGLQMDQMRSEIEKNRQAEAERQRIDGLVRGAIGGFTPQQAIGMDASGPTQAKASMIGQPGQVDYRALYAQGVPMAKIQELVDLGNVNKTKVKNIETINIDGKPVKVGIDEYGQQVAQIGTEWRQMEKLDRGGSIDYLDPYNLSPVASFKRTLTPGEAASNAVARGNLAVSQQRLAFDLQGGAESGANQSGLIRQFGKPPAGYRWKSDGALEVIPGGPADQKAQNQDAGRESVSKVISDLTNYYYVLDKENAIPSTNNRALTNVGAWLGTTGIGQTIGGAVGTKAQSARDSIEQTRPLLMQAIMKATGMSAKQMDSNAELKMYLATATDPTKSLEANRAALARLEEMFGMGAGSLGSGGGNGASGSWGAGKTVKRTGTYNGRKVIEYTDGTVEYGN